MDVTDNKVCNQFLNRNMEKMELFREYRMEKKMNVNKRKVV